MQDTATRIDFYVLESTSPSDRLNFVCRLCEKAYQASHRIVVLTASAAQASELDTLLWTYKADAFLPHNLCGDSQQVLAPITIAHEPADWAVDDMLINLSAALPEGFDRFNRIAEIIDASADVRQAGRQHFSDYRAAGLRPETHNIGST